MAHIHTEPGQYDHTTSIYLFRTDFGEPKIMLHLHRKVGKYTQFGGHIELHESPWEATVRELKEETGYGIDQVQILQPERVSLLTMHPGKGNLLTYCCLLELKLFLWEKKK